LPNKKLAGELDIESCFADTFRKTEREFVGGCAAMVAEYIASP
jgi:putative methionine-R-sulfoxide reductase with GAF domain